MKNEKDKNPGKAPERKQPEKEKSGYPHETEVVRPHEGNDANYTEQNDATGPDKREFPSVGPAETDFASRPHGRTTGRMVGHEPGTEGF